MAANRIAVALARRAGAALAVVLAGAVWAGAALAEPVRVGIDPTRTYQTFRAWEATVDLFWPPDKTDYRDEIFDRLLDEVGITRLRLGIFSGAENTDRSFERFRKGEIGSDAWRATRYATVNDDADPFHINWDGFDFANLDWRIDTTVLPLLEKARARGIKLEINLNYVAFIEQIRGGVYIHTDPEEYAEFVLATFLHMQEKYGFVPDAFEVLLEPEHVKAFTPAGLALAVAAATRRLEHAGFHPRLIAPSVTDARNAVRYMEAMAAVPDAMALMGELAYHRYAGGQPAVLRGIADEAARLGIETSMLELWFDKADRRVLLSDLRVGQVSAWQGNTVMTHHDVDPAMQKGERVRLKPEVRFLRQYMRYIRPGDLRVEARTTQSGLFEPVAFLTPAGGMTVVMQTGAAGVVEIAGLAAGDYHVSYTTDSAEVALVEPVAVAEGGLLKAEMPAGGVMTVTSRP